MSVQAVDVWQLVVRFWPEVSGIVFGLPLSIALLVLLWRRWRRRRVVAMEEPHCGYCSYQLTGRTDATVCPECGRTLNKGSIVLGRGLRRWPVVVTASLLVSVAGAYYVVHRFVPRANSVPIRGTLWNWFHWPSVGLFNWAVAHRYSSLTFPPAWCLRVVEFDPATGRITRTVFDTPMRRSNGSDWSSRLFAGPQPDLLFMMAQQSAIEIEANTGRVVGEYQLPPDLSDPKIGITDLAMHPSRPVLYAYVDFNIVGQWNLDTGEWTTLETFMSRSDYLMHSLFPVPDAGTVYLRRGLPNKAAESGFDLIDLDSLETVLTVRRPKDDLNTSISATRDSLYCTVSDYRAVNAAQLTGQAITRWIPGASQLESVLSVPLKRIYQIQQGSSGLVYFSGAPIVTPNSRPTGVKSLPVVAVYDPKRTVYLQPLESPTVADMDLSIALDEHWAITFPISGAELHIFDLHAVQGAAPGK